jgi:Family of unknown function (DUF6343)/Protein of unknown function (DUF3099)
MRTGSEPSQARSPLRLRLSLAAFGLLCAITGMVVFALAGYVGWVVAFGAIGLVALTDIAVVIRHIRQGAHWQPGRDIPPYRPADPGGPREPVRHQAPPLETRKRRYLLLMGLCLLLYTLAWTWVRFYSVTAAVAMTVVASIILPLAAIVANAGSPLNRR